MIKPSPSRCFIVLVAALTMSPALASANPHLDPARAAIDELDYGKARASLERALKWGENQPGQVREIHRLLGEVHAALGQSKQAEAHFRRWLALDPGAELPAGSSPKITTPFAAAKKQIGERSLRARCEADLGRDRAIVVVESDPEAQVAGARVVARGTDGAEQRQEARGTDTITVDLPEVDSVDVCALMDEHGNHLIELDVASATGDRPDSGPQLDVGTTAAPAERSFFLRWPLWGTLTLAAAGAGTYFAFETQADQAELDRLNQSSSEHDFATAREVEQRGRRNALITNISFGVAGACAVVTVVTLLTRPGPGREARRTAVITPVPLHKGGGISASFRF